MEIQSLSRLVRQGRYDVPSERVAEAIIRWIDPLALEETDRRGSLIPTDPVSERRASFGPPPPRP